MALTQKSKRKLRQNIVGYLYISPVLIGILIFTLLPIVYSFVCSFYKMERGPFSFNFNRYGNFVGLKNYTDMFAVITERKDFLQSLKVTFTYAVIQIPLTLVLSCFLAVLLNQKVKGMRVFRTLYYLPVIMPAVCTGLLWSRITDPNFGVVNELLGKIGLPAFGWFAKAETSMVSLILVSLFGIGGNMVLWLAQLKNVPQSVYESARLDGAGAFRRMFRITIPLCTPMILYNVIMSIIGVLQTYAQVETLCGAGVDNSLYFFVHNVYHAFNNNNFGYACALSFVLFLIIGLLTMVTLRTGKWVYYGEEG